MINPCGYQRAYDVFAKDLEQLMSIGRRLVDGVKADQTELSKIQSGIKRRKATKKDVGAVGDLDAKHRTFAAQWAKLDDSTRDATNRFHAALDEEDEKHVVRIRGLCAYCVGTGRSDSGIDYLFGEIKTYDSLKGNFPARRAQFSQICNVLAAVVDAAAKQHESMAPSTGIIDRYERLQDHDPEAAAAFYRAHRDEILSEFESRRNADNQQP
jgi:hypothetical protein